MSPVLLDLALGFMIALTALGSTVLLRRGVRRLREARDRRAQEALDAPSRGVMEEAHKGLCDALAKAIEERDAALKLAASHTVKWPVPKPPPEPKGTKAPFGWVWEDFEASVFCLADALVDRLPEILPATVAVFPPDDPTPLEVEVRAYSGALVIHAAAFGVWEQCFKKAWNNNGVPVADGVLSFTDVYVEAAPGDARKSVRVFVSGAIDRTPGASEFKSSVPLRFIARGRRLRKLAPWEKTEVPVAAPAPVRDVHTVYVAVPRTEFRYVPVVSPAGEPLVPLLGEPLTSEVLGEYHTAHVEVDAALAAGRKRTA